MNSPGDLIVSGTVSSPAAGAVLVDTTGITTDYASKQYFDVNVTLYSTIAAVFRVGVYNSDDTEAKVFLASVLAASTLPLRLEAVPITPGQKFKVLSNALTLGSVSVSLSIKSVGGE